MASASVALVSWLSLFLALIKQGHAEITDGCLRCLCEAVSGGPYCAFGGNCHDGVCGPYSITLPYWQDGGRPTVGLDERLSEEGYEKCALDNVCAEETIRGYMRKFHQDCNGDGLETCEDYTAIHFHGGYGCNKPLNELAKNALDACLKKGGGSVQPPPFPDPNNNNIYYPPEQTTYPQIDVRLGE